MSLVGLARRCATAELARRGRAPITTLGLEALAARVIFEAEAAGALPYFSAVSRFPGFARALAGTLTDLRGAGIAADRVAQAGGSASHEVADLLRRFEAQLDAGGLADRAALFDLGAGAAAAGEVDALRRLPILLLDVAIEAEVERRFVAALTAISPAVMITVAAGDEATRASVDAIFAHAAPRIAVEPGPTSAGDSGLARMRAHLFADAVPPAAGAPGDVVFFSAPGEGREVVEIARLVLDRAREGIPFDRMAILLRAPEAYWSLLEAAPGARWDSGLLRAGHPATCPRRAARSWRSSTAPANGCRRGASRSTSPSARSRPWTPVARRSPGRRCGPSPTTRCWGRPRLPTRTRAPSRLTIVPTPMRRPWWRAPCARRGSGRRCWWSRRSSAAATVGRGGWPA